MTASQQAPPIDLDSTTAAWVQAAAAASTEIARLTAIRDRAIEHVKQAMGDAVQARIGGQPAVTWAWSKPATCIDVKALTADLPDVAAKYTREKQAARPFKIIAAAG